MSNSQKLETIDSSNIQNKNGSKLVGLEVLRFVSAIAVLVWHYQHFWYVGVRLTDFKRTEQPLYSVFSLFYEWGVFGVQVFWMISGFIFFWKYLEKIKSGSIKGWQFFVLRFSRLYPLHIVTFLLVALLQYEHKYFTGYFQVYDVNDAYHALLQVFMASNWGLQQDGSFNGPIWSISLEVLVYCFFFLFAKLLGPRWGVVCLVVAVSGLAYQLKLGAVFQCIFCFFLGGLVAKATQIHFFSKHRSKIDVALLGYIGIAAGLFYWHDLFAYKPVVHAYIITVAASLIFAMSGRNLVSGRWLQVAVIAGNTTYSSYLIHFPLQLAAMTFAAWIGFKLPKETVAFFLAYLFLSVALGAAVFKFFEVPTQTWLRRKMLSSDSSILIENKVKIKSSN